MKKFLILLLVLACLIAAAYHYYPNKSSSLRASRDIPEFLLPEFSTSEFTTNIQSIRISEGLSQTEIKRKGDTWVVTNRDDYPASVDRLSSLTRSLMFLSPNRKDHLSPADFAKVKLLQNGKGKPEETGLTLEFYQNPQNPLKTLVFGTTIESKGGSSGNFSPPTRFFRDAANPQTWVVPDITGAYTDPTQWIHRSFIQITDIQSINITRPNPQENWDANRVSPDLEFALTHPTAKEYLDPAKAADLKNLLANPTFRDVLGPLPKHQKALDNPIKAQIKTFEGFTYDLTISAQPTELPPETTPQQTPPDPIYLIHINLNADFQKTRTPGENETPEQKTALDTDHANLIKELEKKLALEKSYANWIYKIDDYTLGSLVKPKQDIISQPQASQPLAPESALPTQPAN